MSNKPVVLVTGAATGIGLTIARHFLHEGYRVHVCDAEPASVAALTESDPEITASIADVADAQAVDALFGDLRRLHGGLNVLVNNAGIAGPTARVEDIATADWERTLRVDLDGPFFCTRLAVPLLKDAGGGSIINIASTAGLFGFPLRAPYAACKWALIGLTKTLAMELGPFGIRVNAICPGSVKGPRIDGVIERDAAERGLKPEQVREVYARQSSMRLFVGAEDVANLAVFMASQAGATMSGQAIGVDGHTESLSNWLDD